MLEDILVPIVIMTGMFATIFGIVYIKSRENMALIDKGINPRSEHNSLTYLKFALLLLGAGVGLLAAFMVDNNIDHKAMTPDGEVYYKNFPAIYFSLIAIGGGLGLVLSYAIERKQQRTKAE